MTTLEDQLRVALHGGLADAAPDPGRLWTSGRRRHHRRTTAGAAVGVVAALGGAAGLAALPRHAPHATLTADQPGTTAKPGTSPATSPATGPTTGPTTHRCSLTATPRASFSVDPDPTAGPQPTAVCEYLYDRATVAPDAGLAAVGLPDPAPGFPLRRVPDDRLVLPVHEGEVQVRTFLLEVTPPDVAGQHGTPTGPEATVTVTRAGAVAFDASARPTGTTLVRGRVAQVLENQDAPSPQVVVRLTTGGFDLSAVGSDYADPQHPPTPEQLAALLDALTGIPG